MQLLLPGIVSLSLRLKFCMLLLRSTVMSLKHSVSSIHRHKYAILCLFYPGWLWESLNMKTKQKSLLQVKIENEWDMRTWYVTQWLESNLINRNPICVKEIICHDMTQLCYFMFLQHCYNTVNTRNYYYIISKDHAQWGWDSADLWSRVVYGIAWAQLCQTRPCIPGVEAGNEQDGHRTIRCCSGAPFMVSPLI